MLFLFSGEDISVFLLTVFAKNDKTALDPKRQTVLLAAAKIGSRAAGDRRGLRVCCLPVGQAVLKRTRKAWGLLVSDLSYINEGEFHTR